MAVVWYVVWMEAREWSKARAVAVPARMARTWEREGERVGWSGGVW